MQAGRSKIYYELSVIMNSFPYSQASDETNLKGCQITKLESIGRALIATKLIERGDVVLRDEPYVLVKTSECTCKSHSDVPLPEHILLALKIGIIL